MNGLKGVTGGLAPSAERPATSLQKTATARPGRRRAPQPPGREKKDAAGRGAPVRAEDRQEVRLVEGPPARRSRTSSFARSAEGPALYPARGTRRTLCW